jgi:hypothetical protein
MKHLRLASVVFLFHLVVVLDMVAVFGCARGRSKVQFPIANSNVSPYLASHAIAPEHRDNDYVLAFMGQPRERQRLTFSC